MISVYHGTESLAYLGPKIWDLVPVELKELQNLEAWFNFSCTENFKW